MDKTYDLLFRVLKSALYHLPFQKKEGDVDCWQDVEKELRMQALLPLAGYAVTLPPEAQPVRWRVIGHKQLTKYSRFLSAENDLTALLHSRGIRFAIVKGTATAVYYPQPGLRMQSDVDVIVEKDRWDDTVRLLEASGYSNELDEGRHVTFKKDNISFEVHRYFASFDGGKSAVNIADDLIYAGLDDTVMVTENDFSFPMLPPLENGLVLLVHINHHIRGGIGLRHIVDWMMYVSSVLDDDFWSREFQPALNRIGLEKLAVTLTGMCQMYLGLRKEGITWCRNANEATCRALMEYLISKGDFGSKSAESPDAKSFFRNVTAPLQFFKALQTVGCRTWKALEKYPFLRPFAWIYQSFRLFFRALKRTGGMKKVYEDYEESHSVNKMLDEIAVNSWREKI